MQQIAPSVFLGLCGVRMLFAADNDYMPQVSEADDAVCLLASKARLKLNQYINKDFVADMETSSAVAIGHAENQVATGVLARILESPDVHEAVAASLLGNKAGAGDSEQQMAAMTQEVAVALRETATALEVAREGSPAYADVNDTPPTAAFLEEKAGLIRILGTLSNGLKLKAVRSWARDRGGFVYRYKSFDDNGVPGTGSLGSGCGGAVDVTVSTGMAAPFSWDLQTGPLQFKIGPPCGEQFLISGQMSVSDVSKETMQGEITAGFVNLRSTLKGTWSSGGHGLNGTLLIHLKDMIETKWSWAPAEPTQQKQN